MTTKTMMMMTMTKGVNDASDGATVAVADAVVAASYVAAGAAVDVVVAAAVGVARLRKRLRVAARI